MLITIDGTEQFKVIKTYNLSNYTGDYRIIQYEDSGYYAIQKLFKKDSIYNESDEDKWITILISPIKDKSYDDSDSIMIGLYLGSMIVNEVMSDIVEADNSFNGDYWTLKLYLSEDGEENFTEIITHGEGETLLEQIDELYQLEKEQRIIYLEEYPQIRIYEYILYIIFGCVIILVSIFLLSGLYGVL